MALEHFPLDAMPRGKRKGGAWNAASRSSREGLHLPKQHVGGLTMTSLPTLVPKSLLLLLLLLLLMLEVLLLLEVMLLLKVMLLLLGVLLGIQLLLFARLLRHRHRLGGTATVAVVVTRLHGSHVRDVLPRNEAHVHLPGTTPNERPRSKAQQTAWRSFSAPPGGCTVRYISPIDS